ncbi:uncharacterized protein LOC109717169 [Ananas comosus]|uniref:Uncharacterized protein LOC109717169 n=1 Tax=Ananas comosus TaxID=4615 RepID=A0A199W8K8_ANACO|nr:uncharacterized protein LOC109717169 [Ananas comosus]OAY85571.1 Werner Syndrome-like exonuclease [Ananas comosus]
MARLYEVTFAGIHNIRASVTPSAEAAAMWIESAYKGSRSSTPNNPQVVGLDTKLLPELRPGDDDHPVALLLLCIGKNCLIFQLLHCNTLLPLELNIFLADPRFCFVGVGVREAANRLHREHALRVSETVDLRDAAAQKTGLQCLRQAGLEYLVKNALGVDLAKPEEVQRSAWQQRELSLQEVAYACADVFASFELGSRLLS